MNKLRVIGHTGLLGLIVSCLICGSCQYEVPITAKPTRKIDERFLGDWISKDEKSGEIVRMKVAKLDDNDYVVFFDKDLYRVYHSDVAGAPFVSVQDLDSKERKYSYSEWKLNTDGTLVGRTVNDKVVPDGTKSSDAVQKLLGENLKNPALFEEPMKFTKEK